MLQRVPEVGQELRVRMPGVEIAVATPDRRAVGHPGEDQRGRLDRHRAVEDPGLGDAEQAGLDRQDAEPVRAGALAEQDEALAQGG